MIQRHAHSWLGWDGEQINYNTLTNKPVTIDWDVLDIRISSPTNWQVLTYNGTWGYWENI